MDDDDLREQFRAWTRPVRAAAPPPLSAIAARAHRRTARLAASGLAAVVVLAAGGFQLSRLAGPGGAPGPAPSAPVTGASYAAAPYYVAATDSGTRAGVWDAVTGKKLGAIAPPRESSGGRSVPTIFTDIAAAGDDRTFVLAAVANTNSIAARPVWFFRLRLNSRGVPGPLRSLSFPHRRQGMVGRWSQNIASIALSFDGARLAIATDRNSGDTNGPPDIEVVTLATGATRTWTAAPQDFSSLSWAGDHTLAFACDGVCVLDTNAPGLVLTRSIIRIPWSTRYRGMQGLQWPMITPDGSAIYVAMEGGGIGLVEFSARTGRPVRTVIAPQATAGEFCGALRADSSGSHLTAACTWPGYIGTISGGHFTRGRSLPPAHPADVGNGAGGFVIAW